MIKYNSQLTFRIIFGMLLFCSTIVKAQLVGTNVHNYTDFHKYTYIKTISNNIMRYECWEKTHPYFIALQTISVQSNIILQYTFGIEAKHAIPQCTKFVQDSYYEVQNSLREGCISHQTRDNEDIYQMPDNIEVILHYNYKDGKNSYTMCSTLK